MSSDSFVPVGSVADIKPGTAKTVDIGGVEVAVFNAAGTLYALENTCPHQGASLSEGWIDGTTVTCPWHAWCFDLTDGKMTIGAWATVHTYDLRIDNGQVSVSRVTQVRSACGPYRGHGRAVPSWNRR